MESFDWLFGDPSPELVQTDRSPDEPVWTTAKGDKIPLSKMTNSHICNCINLLKDLPHRSERNNEWLNILRNEYLKRLNTPLDQEFSL